MQQSRSPRSTFAYGVVTVIGVISAVGLLGELLGGNDQGSAAYAQGRALGHLFWMVLGAFAGRRLWLERGQSPVALAATQRTDGGNIVAAGPTAPAQGHGYAVPGSGAPCVTAYGGAMPPHTPQYPQQIATPYAPPSQHAGYGVQPAPQYGTQHLQGRAPAPQPTPLHPQPQWTGDPTPYLPQGYAAPAVPPTGQAPTGQTPMPPAPPQARPAAGSTPPPGN